MDHVTFSSKSLRETINKKLEGEGFVLCDFFGLAQEETAYAELDRSAEYYSCPDVNGLDFFRWKDAGHRDSLMERIRLWEAELPENTIVFWPEIVFDIRSGLCVELQKLNWVLEEIYDLALAGPGMERVYQGRISPAADVEMALKAFYQNKGEELVTEAEKRMAARKDQVGWFEVDASLRGNVLTAKITAAESVRPRAQYYYYLIRDGQVIDKQGWFSDKDTFSWELTENGIYCVQGYVMSGTVKEIRKSQPLSYFNEALKAEFREFLDAAPGGGYPYKKELELYRMGEPFSNIVLNVSKRDDSAAEDKFVSAHSWIKPAATAVYGGIHVSALASGGVRQLPNGDTLLFSGTMLLEDKIAMGIGDIPVDIRPETLAAGQGNYAYAWIGKDEMQVSADYFALSQWFYYEDENRLVMSDHYQTLLVFLRELGLSLELDRKKAAITLAAVRGYLFEYNFLRRMDVAGVFQLEIDKSYRITAGGWEKVETENGRDARRREVYHENQYLALLGKAADEVKKQVRLVLEDERWEHVLLELSGGLDTRVVLGAVTNVCTGKLRDKLLIRSLYVMADLPIATELAGMYGYKYNDLPTTQQVLSVSQSDQVLRGNLMGLCFDHYQMSSFNVDPSYISLRGGCSESVSRPYPARHLFNVGEQWISTPRRIAEYVWRSLADNIMAADQESGKDFEDYLSEELELIPVEDKVLAYDRLYLSYQSGYHFGGDRMFKKRDPVWMPIPSKTLLRLHTQTCGRFRGIKLQLDLIAKLNPLLLNVRLESDKDNASLAEERDRLAPIDPRYAGLHISGPNEMENWKTADDRRIASIKQIYPQDEPSEQIAYDWTRVDDLDLAALKDDLRELMKREPVLRERIGDALYYHLKNGDDMKRMRVFYNKVASLLDQDRIIHGE